MARARDLAKGKLKGEVRPPKLDWKLSFCLRVATRMAKHPEPSTDDQEPSVRRLKQALHEMSIAELCDLMASLQAKLLEAARPQKADR